MDYLLVTVLDGSIGMCKGVFWRDLAYVAKRWRLVSLEWIVILTKAGIGGESGLSSESTESSEEECEVREAFDSMGIKRVFFWMKGSRSFSKVPACGFMDSRAL